MLGRARFTAQPLSALLHVIGFGATAKSHFQACALRHFGASLLPGAVVEVAVAICLNSLFAHCSAVNLNGNRHCLPITKEYLLFEYKDVFEGIGKLPGGPYRIQLKCDVQPVQHPPRAVPEKKKPAYEEEPESLELENLAAHSYLSGVQGQLLELP